MIKQAQIEIVFDICIVLILMSQSLNLEIKQIKDILSRDSSTFQVTQIEPDELSFDFVCHDEKHSLLCNIVKSYPSATPIWSTNSNHEQVAEVIIQLSKESFNTKYKITAMIRFLFFKLCSKFDIPNPDILYLLGANLPPEDDTDDSSEDDEIHSSKSNVLISSTLLVTKSLSSESEQNNTKNPVNIVNNQNLQNTSKIVSSVLTDNKCKDSTTVVPDASNDLSKAKKSDSLMSRGDANVEIKAITELTSSTKTITAAVASTAATTSSFSATTSTPYSKVVTASSLSPNSQNHTSAKVEDFHSKSTSSTVSKTVDFTKSLSKQKEASSKNPSGRASKRLMKEFQAITNSENVKDGCYKVELVEDNLFEWSVEIYKVDEDCPLHRDLQILKQEGKKSSVDLNFTFKDNYPFDPPFVRVTYPYIRGGYVITAGAICLELLTTSGWSSVYSVESVILQIIAALSQGNARIVFGMSTASYNRTAAERMFSRLSVIHDKAGWYSMANSG